VFNNPAISNFDPKENKPLNEFLEKMRFGVHLAKNHKNRVFKKFRVKD
jgi:DNA-binding CsgD family transcriptional regulator